MQRPCAGPSYETPTEVEALKRLGCDTVGMSTVPEIITSAHCGVNVLGLSMVTDLCHGPSDDSAAIATTHSQVLRAVNSSAGYVRVMEKTSVPPCIMIDFAGCSSCAELFLIVVV